VDIDDEIGEVLMTRIFWDAQGKNVPTGTIYEDNKTQYCKPGIAKLQAASRCFI